MAKIIDMMTRGSWKRPSHTGGACSARWARGIGAPGGNGFENAGLIAMRDVLPKVRRKMAR